MFYQLVLINTESPDERLDPILIFNTIKRLRFIYWDHSEDFHFFHFGYSTHITLVYRTGKVKSLLENKNVIRDYLGMTIWTGSEEKKDLLIDKAIEIAFKLKEKYNLEIYDPYLKIFIDQKNISRLKVSLELNFKKFEKLKKKNEELDKQYQEKERRLVALTESNVSFDFLYRFPISIAGDIVSGQYNIINISGIDVLLSDKPFVLFLRLIEELKKGGEGFVYRIDLIEDGYLSRRGSDQGISRLKQQIKSPLEAFLRKFDINGFIEKRPKQIRLSNTPNLIRINFRKLLQHPNPAIVKLAEQLKDRSLAK